MIVIYEGQQLKDKALEIGKRYKESDKLKKIEMGQLMVGNKNLFTEEIKKK